MKASLVDVEDDRHGAVVDELDFHAGAEDAAGDGHAELLERGAEALVQRLGPARDGLRGKSWAGPPLPYPRPA